MIVFDNSDSGDKLYKFASDNTDVEFGRIDGSFENGQEASFVFSSKDAKTLKNQPNIVKKLSKNNFIAKNVDHSHPSGQVTPSGHYANTPGHPMSLDPVPEEHPVYKEGDAQNARAVVKLKGFENAKFSVYSPVEKTKTIYDGKNKAKIVKD